MQCVGLENSYGISVKCRVLLKSIFPCYNFFVIYLLVGENPSHLSPAKAVSNSLKFLSYDRLKCIPILCGSYLRCIIDE